MSTSARKESHTLVITLHSTPHGPRSTAPPHGPHLTASTTWSPPHGPRLTVPASRSPPHGSRLTVPASRSPPHAPPPPHGPHLTAPASWSSDLLTTLYEANTKVIEVKRSARSNFKRDKMTTHQFNKI